MALAGGSGATSTTAMAGTALGVGEDLVGGVIFVSALGARAFLRGEAFFAGEASVFAGGPGFFAGAEGFFSRAADFVAVAKTFFAGATGFFSVAAVFFAAVTGFFVGAAGFFAGTAGFLTEAAGFFAGVAGFFAEAAGFFVEAAGFFAGTPLEGFATGLGVLLLRADLVVFFFAAIAQKRGASVCKSPQTIDCQVTRAAGARWVSPLAWFQQGESFKD